MAKAKTSPTAISWPPEGLPIDVACKLLMAPLWDDYAKAQDAVGNLDRAKQMVLRLLPDQERRLAARDEARTALVAELRRRLEKEELELIGRRDPMTPDQRIPPSALQWLRLNIEEQSADGEGLRFIYLRLLPHKGWVEPATPGPPPETLPDAMRQPRLVDDFGDNDVGQGNQTRRVQGALGRLRDRGLVWEEHLRPELRRRILKEIEDEAKGTGTSDPLPSRQTVDRVLVRLGIK